MKLVEQIRGYAEHHIGDNGYLQQVIASAPTDAILQELTRILGATDDTDLIGEVCLFIRDITFVPQSASNDLSNRILNSSVIIALEELLFSEGWLRREWAVYTLGKIGSTASIPKLKMAFYHFRGHDPLLLPSLLLELDWLRADDFWSLIDESTRSPLYLTRWSMVETLGERAIEGPKNQVTLRVKDSEESLRLDELRNDKDLYVRSEADYQWQLLNYARTHEPDRKLRKQRRRELDRHKPIVEFQVLKIRFRNFLYENDRHSYSIEELDAFVHSLK